MLASTRIRGNDFLSSKFSGIRGLLEFLLLAQAGAGYAYSEWIRAIYLSLFGGANENIRLIQVHNQRWTSSGGAGARDKSGL